MKRKGNAICILLNANKQGKLMVKARVGESERFLFDEKLKGLSDNEGMMIRIKQERYA